MNFKTIKEVEEYINSTVNFYLNKHRSNWKFEWFNRKRVAGMCSPDVNTINFSKVIFELNLSNEKFIINTVLHEVAHAVDWELNGNIGHGPSWKKICLILGISSERLIDPGSIILPGKHIYKCPSCDFTLTRNNRYKTADAACPNCCKKYNSGIFSEKYLLYLVGS